MYSIKDLIAIDEQAEFRSDVQIDAYDNPSHNLALLRSYLFANATPDRTGEARTVSSIGLLDQLVSSYLDERMENRFLAIANFGHGKSHLALALANYFGRPVASEETNVLLQKIEHGLNDRAKSARYSEFKKNRGEFLVVRLRGDMPQSLRTQFLSGIEKALVEHSATKEVRLPFWHAEAERILSSLNQEEIERADKFLESRQLDVPALLNQVRNREDVHDLCVDVIHAAKQIRPDLKEVSLKEAVLWCAKKLCGRGKAVGGMLILFDEFSLYINRYGQRNAAGELQDLLNGVEDARGVVTFLAFAQHDPHMLVENAMFAASARESLLKELTRLPKKFALYSLMESVIDSYLNQRTDVWTEILQERKIRGWISQATDVAFERFKKHYGTDLRWSMEKFQETVSKGCFPLHPITTALLCNVKFTSSQDVGAPRTVLGFVLQQLEDKREEPVVVDGRPNWILPISLVDYFEARLSSDLYRSYENARRTAGPDATDEELAVLKAVLLQEAAGVLARGSDQIHYLAQSAGLTEEVTKQALDALSSKDAILFDRVNKVSSLWPAGNNPQNLEQFVRRKLETIRLAPQQMERALNHALEEKIAEVRFGQLPVAVDWGHSDDWAARELILTSDSLNKEMLQALVQQTTVDSRGVQEADRGYVFWLLARSEEELTWYREEAARILDAALPSTPPPVVLMLPREPQPELMENFRRWQILDMFTDSERKEVGIDMYNHARTRATAEILRQITRLRGDSEHILEISRKSHEYIVPHAFRSALQAAPPATLRGILERTYWQAYPFSPPEFSTVFRVANKGASRLRTATIGLANNLMSNATPALLNLMRTDKVAQDIAQKFLQQRWQVLTRDFRIQEPQNQRLQVVWQYLESSIPTGSKDVLLRQVLIPLLNPPYGYDYNTVVLVFAVWFGYHAQDLQVSRQGRMITHDQLAAMLAKGPRDFVLQVVFSENVAVARRDPGEVEREIKELIKRAKVVTLSQREAEAAIAQLSAFAQEGQGNADLCASAQQTADNLDTALSNAKKYDAEVTALERQILGAQSIDVLLEAKRKLAGLPRVGNVETTAADLGHLQARLQDQLVGVVEAFCQKYESPDQSSQLDLYHTKLVEQKKALRTAGLNDLITRIDQALNTLARKDSELRIQEDEAGIRAQIQAMRIDSSLKMLYEHRTVLKGLQNLSPSTSKLRDQRLANIEGEILKLEQQIETLQMQIDRITTPKGADELRDATIRLAERYRDTPFVEQLTSICQSAEQLRAFYSTLVGINTRHLTTPAEAETSRRRLAEMQDKFAPVLSKIHLASLKDVREALTEQLEAQRRAALEWLTQRESDLRNGSSLAGLADKLEHVPSFLPEEARPRLKSLQIEVYRAIDQDAVAQIESAFCRLRTYEQREECVKRLLHLLRQDVEKNERVQVGHA